MDLTGNLEDRLLERVFSYLDNRDLVNAASTCRRWRNVASRNLIWERRSKKLGWKHPTWLSETEPTLLAEQLVIEGPENMSDWEKYYKQRMHLQANWTNKVCDRISLLGRDVIIPRHLSYMSGDPRDKNLLPLVQLDEGDEERGEKPPCEGSDLEDPNRVFKFYLVKLDGMPTQISNFGSYVRPIQDVCVYRDYIIFMNGCRVVHCQLINDQFEILPKSYLLQNFGQGEELEYRQDMFFITMNHDYIVAGHQLIAMSIWCRETDEKIVTINYPFGTTFLDNSCLAGNLYFYSTWQTAPNMPFSIEAYDIQSRNKVLTLQCPANVKKLLVTGNYLVTVSDLEPSQDTNLIIVRNIQDEFRAVWSAIHSTISSDPMDITHVYAVDQYLFYCELRRNFVMVHIETGTVFRNIPLVMDESINSIGFASYNLMVVKTNHTITVWDWKQGVQLHVLATNGIIGDNMLVDDIRVLAPTAHEQVTMITFW